MRGKLAAVAVALGFLLIPGKVWAAVLTLPNVVLEGGPNKVNFETIVGAPANAKNVLISYMDGHEHFRLLGNSVYQNLQGVTLGLGLIRYSPARPEGGKRVLLALDALPNHFPYVGGRNFFAHLRRIQRYAGHWMKSRRESEVLQLDANEIFRNAGFRSVSFATQALGTDLQNANIGALSIYHRVSERVIRRAQYVGAISSGDGQDEGKKANHDSPSGYGRLMVPWLFMLLGLSVGLGGLWIAFRRNGDLFGGIVGLSACLVAYGLGALAASTM